MSALASKRGDADKCFASLKDFYGKIDVDGLLKVYLPKLDPLKEAGLEVVSLLTVMQNQKLRLSHVSLTKTLHVRQNLFLNRKTT